MTDEQIVKALGCCIQIDVNSCYSCPLYDREQGCLGGDIRVVALDLIKRQRAEIEKLNKVKVFNFTVSNTKEIMPILFCHEKELKNQAVKEFAKFLIDKAENNVIRIGDLCDYVIDFNEMTEKEGAAE